MRGSIYHQVDYLFKVSGIMQLGESKHAAKELAREAGAKTWHEVGKQIGVHSYATADKYREVARSCLAFAKKNFGIKNIENLEGRHVTAFLQSKIAREAAHATIQLYAAASEKLEAALSRYAGLNHTGRAYNFSEDIAFARAEARGLARFEGSRAYEAPEQIVAEIQADRYQLIAACQYQGGARIDEVRFTPADLQGIRPDPITGQEKGWLAVDGKGGKKRDIMVPPATYQAVAERVLALAPGQHWGIGNDTDRVVYRDGIRQACQQLGEGYHGSHGFRWNYAQERFQEVQAAGLAYNEALSQVSEEMGHERADITEHYLK
jgi:integrase